MAISIRPWDGSASRWPDAAAYCESCAIDDNEPGSDKVQSKCKIPYKEPSGDINRNALGSASAALAGARGGVQASPEAKKSAARKLLRAYAEAKMEPPPSLKRMSS